MAENNFEALKDEYWFGAKHREAKELALAMRAKRKKAKEIVKFFGYNPLMESLADLPEACEITGLPAEEVVRLYDSGLGLRPIGQRFGVGERVVRAVLATSGRLVRRAGAKR